MAEVFISYAKTDRPLASKLAAMLEAEGWSTWWDTSLTIGDDFRNEIMTELGRARAVIVIWTDTSIKSDWVRSEAGRAQADQKLIPVKLPHLTYKDLPPPFDVLHTENIGQEDKIKAAVVARLTKPALEQRPWALLTTGLKYELLIWFAIVGGALTLFTNLGAVLKLADWARVLVQHWKEWTHAFWLWAFSWLGIHLPPEWTPVLTFLLFGLLLIYGQARQYRQNRTKQSMAERYESYDLPSTISGPFNPRFLLLRVIPLIGISWMLGRSVPDIGVPFFRSYIFLVPVIMILLGVYLTSFVIHKLHAAMAMCLLVLFWIIITLNQFIDTPHPKGFAELTAVTVISVLPLILLSVAPAKQVNRRLIFLGLGLLLLIALSELSRLGLNPPD
jgi:hypothetical protein